ncbi:methylaspartate mutase subunit S [Hydrogenimonas sp. SS33]|uniref:methylaspartate mutase subunit S n=1 Tax=Hydrogenimonas leucolamina TaxID=2954236 RepID=UPI00336BBCAF
MKVVTGVVGNDIHVVANRLIEISLKERGFTVYNLGVNTYLEEFLDAMLETDADVLLISSLNGEAEGWCRDLKILRQNYRFRKDPLFVIGGNLAVGEVKEEEIVPKFKNFGFDLVYHQKDINASLDEVQARLKERVS